MVDFRNIYHRESITNNKYVTRLETFCKYVYGDYEKLFDEKPEENSGPLSLRWHCPSKKVMSENTIRYFTS
jgi:hypothetical protein